MSQWVHNPQGKIIATVPSQARQGRLKGRARGISAGIILVVVLVIVTALVIVWPGDNPAALPVSAEQGVDVRLVSGVAGALDGEQHLVTLTTSGDEFAQPALTVFTVDDDGVPRQTSTLPAPVDRLDSDLPAAPGIALSGNTAYVPLAGVHRSALWIVDLSDPRAPRALSATELETTPGTVAIDGDLAAIGPLNGTLTRIFDVSDPANPRQTGEYVYPTRSPTDLRIAAGVLYVAGQDGVVSVDLSTPASPREIATWAAEFWHRGVPLSSQVTSPRIAMSEGHVVAAADIWGVEVLDVSDPEDIDATTNDLRRTQVAGPGSPTSRAVDLAVIEDDLYLLQRREHIGGEPPAWEYAVRHIDLADPGDPQIVAETDAIPGAAGIKSLVAGDGSIYFLNGAQIHIINAS